jgi:hypothetical protein
MAQHKEQNTVTRLVVCGMMQLVVLLVLVACNPSDAFVSQEQRETEQALGTARVETAVYSGTQVGTVAALQATADGAPVMQTQLAQLERENMELQLTVQAIETVGVPAGLRVTQSPQGPTPTATQAALYMDLRTTTDIDPDTGCAVDRQGRFSADASIIYLAAIGQNVEAGSVHRTRWFMDDELRHESDTWIPEEGFPQVCIYFWIEPIDTPFTSGLWSVQLLVNGEIVADVPFEICAEDEAC